MFLGLRASFALPWCLLLSVAGHSGHAFSYSVTQLEYMRLPSGRASCNPPTHIGRTRRLAAVDAHSWCDTYR